MLNVSATLFFSDSARLFFWQLESNERMPVHPLHWVERFPLYRIERRIPLYGIEAIWKGPKEQQF